MQEKIDKMTELFQLIFINIHISEFLWIQLRQGFIWCQWFPSPLMPSIFQPKYKDLKSFVVHKRLLKTREKKVVLLIFFFSRTSHSSLRSFHLMAKGQLFKILVAIFVFFLKCLRVINGSMIIQLCHEAPTLFRYYFIYTYT